MSKVIKTTEKSTIEQQEGTNIYTCKMLGMTCDAKKYYFHIHCLRTFEERRLPKGKMSLVDLNISFTSENVAF